MSGYSSLMEKYGGGSVPAFKITCGGAELKQSDFIFTDIAADVGVGRTAGAARFTITNIYEPGSRQFSAGAQKSLKPGAKVSVSLGYGSDVTEVFTGYLDELFVRLADERMSFTAFCLDARGLMRGGSAYAAAKDKTMEDVVKGILDKYGALITSKDVTLEALEQDVNITQTGCDLDFVCEAADARGAAFYIDCGKAVIGEFSDDVCVEFDWEQFGLEFSLRYLDEKITVYGHDIQNMTPFTAETPAKQTAAQEKLLTVESAVRVPHHINAESAKKRADALAKTKVAEALRGKITCVGLPEAKVGRAIKINKFPLTAMQVPDRLTVRSVGHSFDHERGFVTEIEIGGA